MILNLSMKVMIDLGNSRFYDIESSSTSYSFLCLGRWFWIILYIVSETLQQTFWTCVVSSQPLDRCTSPSSSARTTRRCNPVTAGERVEANLSDC